MNESSDSIRISGAKPNRQLSLAEARELWHDNHSSESRKSIFGAKAGLRPGHGLIDEIETALLFPRLHELTGGDARLHGELGEWLAAVIRDKDALKLRDLANAILLERLPCEQHPSQGMLFLDALHSFLWSGNTRGMRTTKARQAEQRKGRVPTKSELRRKLGWETNVFGKVATRLGWNNLPEARGGRPRKPSTAKRKMR